MSMGLKKAYGKAAAALIRIYIRVVYRPECINREAGDRPVLYVSNHISHLDGLLMLTALHSERPYALTAKDWFDKKLLGPVFEAARCLPINRFGLDTSWLRVASEKLRAGKSVIVFPEGHTVHGGELDEFKPGFAMLAKMTGAPVVPVWHGPGRAFRKTKIVFGPASCAELPAMTSDALRREGERFRGMVEALGRQNGGGEV